MQRILMIACVSACISLVGCDNQKQINTPLPQSVKAIQAQVVPYQDMAEISGEVAARFQADLGFRTNGRVIERLVDVGARVHKGQILARLDDVEKKADVDIALATLRSARATFQFKKSVFNRDQKLLISRAISQANWDQAREELATAQAVLASAKSSLDAAEDALTFTVLKSDVDGVIISRQLEVGQVVASAQTVFTLAHDGPRDAVFQVSESIFLNGQLDNEIEVRLISMEDSNVLTASVREIAPILNESSGIVRVKANLPAVAQWPLGAPIVGSFQATVQHGLVLPASAMSSVQGKPAVWVIDDAKGTVSLHEITVSRYRSLDFVVTKGLGSGSWVVTEGGKFLRVGQHVSWERK